MSSYAPFSDEQIDRKAKQLEASGKITEAACILYITGEDEAYWEEMRGVAWNELFGLENKYLTKKEIAELVEIYSVPSVDDDKYSESDYDRPSDYDRASDYDRPSNYDRASDYDRPSNYDRPSDYDRSSDYDRPSIHPSREQYSPPSSSYDSAYATDDSGFLSFVWELAKFFFAIITGMIIPYLIYKLAKTAIKAVIRSK